MTLCVVFGWGEGGALGIPPEYGTVHYQGLKPLTKLGITSNIRLNKQGHEPLTFTPIEPVLGPYS